MDYQKQIDAVVQYIKSGEKEVRDFSIGVEMEHFILHNDSLKTVSYYGQEGVGSSLLEIAESSDSYDLYKEGDYILGLSREKVDISTEPGSQFEVAVDFHIDISVLEKRYAAFLKEAIGIFEKKDQRIVTLGYHPVTKIEEIKILPKKRYDFMYNYFKTKGDMAHNMMKGTCALQIIIDFKEEEDFKKKYRVANILSPVLYALFDNSYIFEGEPYEEYNLREKIWENTDKDRSGIFELAFQEEVSYRTYAEKILNTPLIFMEEEGKQVSAGKKTLKDVLDPDKNNDELIFHALSIVFPDVRVKRYLELRMMDSVPYPLNFSCIGLVKGLFYNEKNLEALYQDSLEIQYEDVMAGKKEIRAKGLQGMYKGKTILEWGKKITAMAEDGLPEEEKHYLEPLKALLEEGKNPRDQFEELYEKEGLRQAVDWATMTGEVLDA
ncbi:MAG: glutamate-cysteine ligase family protein [Gallicola sp.]|nr:glutamate-cysteine ligase family protein [Gallicola sp.]